MIYNQRVYSVLVVSSVQKFNDTMTAMLPETDYDPVCFVSNIGAARRELLRRNYDFIIINTPLPDDFGTRFAVDVCSQSNAVVLLLVRAEMYAAANAKAGPQGVFILLKPTASQTFQQALNWMASARERLRRMEKKATSIEEKMEEIRLVNRAKWLLIECLKMTEEDAHHFIEKQAMDRCISRKEVATGIIKTYS